RSARRIRLEIGSSERHEQRKTQLQRSCYRAEVNYVYSIIIFKNNDLKLNLRNSNSNENWFNDGPSRNSILSIMYIFALTTVYD
ncbi:MAG: hypothetical protein CL833_00090, partial [Crocinitomicaceae bacterium]|nr:hypothetical protein [Crocinitomicaceae bacterium]